MRRLMLTGAVITFLVAGCAGGTVPGSTDTPTDPGAEAPATPEPAPPAVPVTDPGETPAPSSPVPGPTEEPARPASGPPFSADTSADTSEGHGPLVTLTDVRIGRHEGFDRVVFDLGGGGTAGWTAAYTDDPKAQGSGDPVEVAGGAVLAIDLTHTGYPDDTGVEFYDGPRRLAGATAVREVLVTGMYEGHTQLFVGVSAERPFRVYALEGRVVLEVAHGDGDA